MNSIIIKILKEVITLLAIFISLVVIVFFYASFTHHMSDVFIWKDEGTGCQYVANSSGGIVPRLDLSEDGRVSPICEEIDPNNWARSKKSWE